MHSVNSNSNSPAAANAKGVTAASWSPATGLAAAKAPQGAKRKAPAMAACMKLFLIATVDRDMIVETGEARGCTLVVAAPPDNKAKKDQLKTLFTKRGLSLLPLGMMPFFNGKELSKHTKASEYAENQLPSWSDAVGFMAPIFNRAHLERMRLEAITLFGNPDPDINFDDYDAAHDPTVFIVTAKPGTLINGDHAGENTIILDVAGKRSLRLYWSLLNEINFYLCEVTWPEEMGGETASYWVKKDGAIADAVAFTEEFNIPNVIVA